MLKSALQFKILLLFILIIPLKAQALSGIIVLRVSQSLYDLKTIQDDYKLLLNFDCMYPTSLLTKLVGLDSSDKWIENASTLAKPMKKSQKETFEKMIRFYKMRDYVKGKQIHLTKSLTQLLIQSSKLNGCETQGLFIEDRMSGALSYMTKLEVLFSNRKQRLSNFDEEKLDESLGFIYTTINRQFSHKFLWD